MDPYVRVRKKHLARISKDLAWVAKETGKDLDKLITTAGGWALTSASKATEPGKGLNVNKLAQKWLYRPIKKIPDSEGFWYAWSKTGVTGMENFTGKMFRSDERLTGFEKSGRAQRIRFGFEYWSRTRKRMSFLPYWDGTDSKPKKYDKTNKRGRIRSSGAAKYGWLSARARLRGTVAPKGNIYHAAEASRLHRRYHYMKAVNHVTYIMKVGARSADIGIAMAAKQVDGFLVRILAKKYQRKFRR